MRTINHYIGGKEVAGTSGRSADVFNPATGEVQAKVALASAAELDAAVKNAQEAFPGWANTPPLTRARIMFKFKQLAEENTDTWKLEDGVFVAHGEKCHLFYIGDGKTFKNFHLKVEVMTEPNSNGGIYFHTKYQAKDWPRGGFECQVNNTHSDWKKTGSLYDVVNIANSAAQDRKWWTQEIIVKGNNVTVIIDGKKQFDYTEPAGAQAGTFERKLGEGTFALQGHDPKSTIRYRNIRVKRLD